VRAAWKLPATSGKVLPPGAAKVCRLLRLRTAAAFYWKMMMSRFCARHKRSINTIV
jgi:hypothetical protein